MYHELVSEKYVYNNSEFIAGNGRAKCFAGQSANIDV